MIASLARRLLPLPVVVLLMAAAPLVDPLYLDAPASLSQKEITTVVRKTLVQRNWILVKDSGNEIVARLDVRGHSITVRYTVDSGRRITMKYLDSVAMDYALDRHGKPVIHRKYAGWMLNVQTALSRELQLATLAKSN